MKKVTMKLLLALAVSMFAIGTQAQLRIEMLYTTDDWTIDEGHKDAGIEWANNLCNNDDDGTNGNGYQEAWIKWDLSTIQLSGGEEILSADVLFRTAGNYMEQGYEAIVLSGSTYDSWDELAFNWNAAAALGDYIADGGDTAVVVPIGAGGRDFINGEFKATEKFSIINYLKNELAGDQTLTMRLKPYYDTFSGNDKKWLGFFSRQNTFNWGEGEKVLIPGEADSISAYSPRIKLLIGVPSSQFSTIDPYFGNLDNYKVNPEGFWYAVEDHTNDGRLLMLENFSNKTDSLGALAIYKNKNDYTDFELSLDARVNDAISAFNTNLAIIFDYQDSVNYTYYGFYGMSSTGVDSLNGVYRVVNGERSFVGEAKRTIAIQDDNYHTYSLKREGTVVTAYVDGNQIHTVDDPSLGGVSGSLGFGSAKYLVNFDNVQEASTANSIYTLRTQSEIKIYPNPAKDNIFVSSDNTINYIEVYDVVGNIILSVGKLNSLQLNIDVSALPEGIYLVITESKGIRSSGKFIKE